MRISAHLSKRPLLLGSLFALSLSLVPSLFAQAFGFGSDDGAASTEATDGGGANSGGDSFGFGDDGSGAAGGSEVAAKGATVGGSIGFSSTLFPKDVSGIENYDDLVPDTAADAKLQFSAVGSSAEAGFTLKVSEDILTTDPASLIDEAYVRLFKGPLTLEGGLLKLTWGKADSLGPLDVLNPTDYTDLTVTDSMDRKVAVPMLHATVALGDFSSLQVVGLPSFTGNKIAWSGRWMPAQIEEQMTYLTTLGVVTDNVIFPETDSLGWSQAGIRYTTSLGGVDLGAQYFYGFLGNPAVSISDMTSAYIAYTYSGYGAAANANQLIHIDYNRYHQIGVDAATVLAGFNLRTELAANITEDLSGDDPEVYNPSIAWSLGFDRDLVLGINLNLQGTGSVRLMDDQVGAEGTDLEGGTDATSTTITAVLSKKFLKDTLELKAIGVYEVEAQDFLITPMLSYYLGDATAELSGGWFGGDEDGAMGSFADNSFVKVALSYSF